MPPYTPPVFIGFGSNVGDRESNYRTAIEALHDTESIDVRRHSSLCEYPPLGPPQADYVNGVIELTTGLQPADLLAELNRIEAEMGRERVVHWGPRTVDLDILFWGDLILQTETLTIPHPGACERLFVLEPMAELAPEFKDPRSGRTILEILESMRG